VLSCKHNTNPDNCEGENCNEGEEHKGLQKWPTTNPSDKLSTGCSTKWMTNN